MGDKLTLKKETETLILIDDLNHLEKVVLPKK